MKYKNKIPVLFQILHKTFTYIISLSSHKNSVICLILQMRKLKLREGKSLLTAGDPLFHIPRQCESQDWKSGPSAFSICALSHNTTL